MSAARDALVDVLAQHQPFDWSGNYRGCICGADKPDGADLADWIAEHQADALATAGIHPFRPNHTETP